MRTPPRWAAAIGRARDAGHIFVAGRRDEAKNIDTTPSYPASYIRSYDNVVVVAATDSSDRLANFSNYGAGSVTLAAPGVGIYSTTPNNTYSSFSGTSMATPHVTGAIALYWSANPGLTYQQVISQLKSAVDPVAGPEREGRDRGPAERREDVRARYAGPGRHDSEPLNRRSPRPWWSALRSVRNWSACSAKGASRSSYSTRTPGSSGASRPPPGT